MNFKIPTFWKTFCCVLLFASSVNVQKIKEKSDDEWNSEKSKMDVVETNDQVRDDVKGNKVNEIEDRLNQLLFELNQSKEREILLKNEIDKIGKVIIQLNKKNVVLETSIAEINLHVNNSDANYEKRFKEFSIRLNHTKVQFDVLRNDVDEINKVVSELNINNKTLEKTVILPKPQLCDDSLDVYYKTEEPDFIWTINDIKNMINHNQSSVESEVFPLKGYPFGGQLKLTQNNSEYQVDFSYKDIKKTGQPLNFKVTPAVIYTYKNQTKPPPSNIIFPRFQRFNSTLQYDVFAYGACVLASTGNMIDDMKLSNERIVRGEIGDTLVIAVHVEPPRLVQHSCSFNGTLTNVVRDYRKKKVWDSDVMVMNYAGPSFFTSPTGFKLQFLVRLYENKSDGKKGLIANIDMLSGPYDNSLGAYSSFNVSLTFLHPTDPTKHVIKNEIMSISGILVSAMHVAREEEIENLWVGDILYYNVTIIAI